MHILLVVGIILLALWFLGLIFRVFGGIIHVLLVIALILIVVHFLVK